MQGESCTDRQIIEIGGDDRLEFLQGLVTNDIAGLDHGLVYAAVLSPQGKYLADFFLVPHGDLVLLDVQADLAKSLLQRLTLYKLRAKVTLAPVELHVTRGLGEAPEGAFADPRDPSLGWRAYGSDAGRSPVIDWHALYVAAGIPQTGVELIPNDTYILEAGFERLNGVDFKKGCYVGQEVTARMKHKTELKKGLARVSIEGAAPVGTAITADGKPAGTLFSQADGQALAHLRFDRAGGEMQADDARLWRATEPAN